MKILYARNLYTQENIKVRIPDNYEDEINANNIITFNSTYYVAWKKIKVENCSSQVRNTISFNDIHLMADKKAILIGVNYESKGKTYHYWSDVLYDVGTKIKLMNDKIVTVTSIPTLGEYENTLSCKFLPKKEVLSTGKIVNMRKVDFTPFSADDGTALHLTTATLRLSNSTEIKVGEYYKLFNGTVAQVKRILPIQCDSSKENLVPLKVEPFLCQFKDSNERYLYFTHIPPVKGVEYKTSQGQILKVIVDGFCRIDNNKKKIFTPDGYHYNFQDVRMKYRYKSLKPTTPLIKENIYSLSNPMLEIGNSATLASDKIDQLVYGINTITNVNRIPSNATFSVGTTPTLNDNINIRKENKTMNFMKNLEFGKINTNDLRMSINGLAYRRNDGSYATYNAKDNSFMDVTGMLLDFDYIYVMPVAAKDLKEGDIVKHLNNYVVVSNVNEDGTISAISPIKAEEIIIIPTKNMFGFNYYSKVFNIFDGAFKADETNPFGNPLALMMLCGENGGFNGDMKSIIPLLLLSNQNENSNDFMKNPLLLAAFLK